MPAFSDIVWVIPILYMIIFLLGLTVSKTKQQLLISSSLLLSFLALILSGGIVWERSLAQADDYSFYFDWLVIGDTSYRLGYELNNSSAWLLGLVSLVNVLVLTLLYHKKEQQIVASVYGYIGLILFAASGMILADNMMLFLACALLLSYSILLLISHPVLGCKPKAIYRYITAQLFGYACFLIAIAGLYWYMPNHSMQFTMFETFFNGMSQGFTMRMQNVIAGSLVMSAILIAGIFPYANWMKHVDIERPILRVVIFCFGNALLPIVILLRFQMIISEVNDVLWLCKIIGSLIVIWCTLRMLINAKQATSYIGIMMIGSIVFAYGFQAYTFMLVQLTIMMLSLIVIYGAALQSSSITVYGAFLVAVLTLIGVPPLSGYWIQQSLVAMIAEQHHLGWYIVSLVLVMCSALGTTIYFASYLKRQFKQSNRRGIIAIIMWPAALLIALGLFWIIGSKKLELWLYEEVMLESMRLVPMILTMLSVVIGVVAAWLFSERITEALDSSLDRMDERLRRDAETVGLAVTKTGRYIVIGVQWLERVLVQILTVWIPYPVRIISRVGAEAGVLRSIGLVVFITLFITAVWFGVRRG